MLRVITVGAPGRFRVELESGVVQLLEASARSVEAHDRVLPDQLEELAAFCLARPELLFVGQVLQDFGLILSAQVAEGLSVKLLGASIQPRQSIAKAVLDARVTEGHEIDELAYARFTG